MEYVALEKRHAPQMARLHVEGIKTGFISSLGEDFLTVLYEAIAGSEFGFGFVALDKDRVVAFLAMTTDLGRLYRSVVLKKGLRFALVLAGKMLSSGTLKKAVQSLLYPSRVKKLSLPCAELLSVVTDPEYRGRGLAGELLRRTLEECRRRGIGEFKVLVGAEMESANNWYIKHGFKLRGRMDSHGRASNIYTIDTG